MLKGKNVIITGSNRGIGRAAVERFAANGANIWACARKQTGEFEADMASLAEKYGVWIKPVYFDLSDSAQIDRGMKEIFSEKLPVDILLNNAGVAHGALFTMTSIETMRQVFEVNVFAQVHIMQLAARKMMRQKSGCIINMCSVGGINTDPGYLAYGSSKAALAWITKSVSKELGRYNIRVNGIAPGLIDTDMGMYKSPEELEKVRAKMSLDRTGSPEEVADAAVYIASDSASYMTGHILVLDGGRQ